MYTCRRGTMPLQPSPVTRLGWLQLASGASHWGSHDGVPPCARHAETTQQVPVIFHSSSTAPTFPPSPIAGGACGWAAPLCAAGLTSDQALLQAVQGRHVFRRQLKPAQVDAHKLGTQASGHRSHASLDRRPPLCYVPPSCCPPEDIQVGALALRAHRLGQRHKPFLQAPAQQHLRRRDAQPLRHRPHARVSQLLRFGQGRVRLRGAGGRGGEGDCPWWEERCWKPLPTEALHRQQTSAKRPARPRQAQHAQRPCSTTTACAATSSTSSTMPWPWQCSTTSRR